MRQLDARRSSFDLVQRLPANADTTTQLDLGNLGSLSRRSRQLPEGVAGLKDGYRKGIGRNCTHEQYQNALLCDQLSSQLPTHASIFVKGVTKRTGKRKLRPQGYSVGRLVPADQTASGRA